MHGRFLPAHRFQASLLDSIHVSVSGGLVVKPQSALPVHHEPVWHGARLLLEDLDHEHAVVGHESPAALADDVRVGDVLLVADLAEVVDDLKSSLSTYSIGFHLMPIGSDEATNRLVEEMT